MQMPLSLIAIAERIDTGTDDPETSRALVVFNQTDQPMSGIGVFQASMSWPRETSLPPVIVTETDGNPVSAALMTLTVGLDAKGRPDRSQLSFSLRFAVSDVPANGWRTYIASYAKNPSPVLLDCTETPGLVVVETTRHGGDLPPVGKF